MPGVKWRCPQCGKPHEKNDPPCDNCGHHKFERAVVPTASAGADHEQFVWACSECGRHHQRNNPPCSRCGNAKFEKKPLDYGEFEPDDTPSYFELAGRLEVGAALVVIALVTVGVLGYMGVITIPGLTPQGPPTVENVPGNASSVGNLSLSAVESEYLASVNDQRTSAGERALETDQELDTLATFYNQRRVKARYADGTLPSTDELRSKFDISCGVRLLQPRPVSLDVRSGEYDAAGLGELLATNSPLDTEQGSRTGIDIHVAPDGKIFLTQALC